MLALAAGLVLIVIAGILFCTSSSRAAAQELASLSADEPEPALQVGKTASPYLVQDGARLTYTLRITNTGLVSLTATITDVLPALVSPSGSLRWTALITPEQVWTRTIPVTVTEGYTGALTNLVAVTTEEGAASQASVTTCVNACQARLPIVRQAYSGWLPPREWDPRLDELGVTLEPATVEPGQPHWRLVEARWADPDESAQRHHIFFEVLDENEERAAGQPVIVDWPDGSQTLYIKPGPLPTWGADYGMYSVLGSYGAQVGGSMPSDRVAGMGLGTIEEPDIKHHTSFYLTFRLVP
jgi:uncharacterized repeat protein (TIGR01451 family)